MRTSSDVGVDSRECSGVREGDSAVDEPKMRLRRPDMTAQGTLVALVGKELLQGSARIMRCFFELVHVHQLPHSSLVRAHFHVRCAFPNEESLRT